MRIHRISCNLLTFSRQPVQGTNAYIGYLDEISAYSMVMPNLNIVYVVNDDHSVSHKNIPDLFGLLKMV
ncbi:MAG: hypothetical protein WKF36_07785 [Candidatus Nitrosocosmicus sp.]